MGAVFALLVILVTLQIRTLKSFEWSALTQTFDSIRWLQLALAIVLVYGAYITRAFRWSIFLRPTKPALRRRWSPHNLSVLPPSLS